MNNKKNAISAVALQLAFMAQGFIIPRLILDAFGSEVNGLVASITQFLGFIALLEGGLGAVVLAELYTPIVEHDDNKVRNVMASCQSFFNKLACVYIIYTFFLALVYPSLTVEGFSFLYIFSLVFILSLTTLSQYLLSITYKIYLQADQRIYVVNYVSTVTILLNTILTIIIIKLFPDVHLVKFISGAIYFIQPIVFRFYVDKRYRLSNISALTSNGYVFQNRWSGFSQNLAHFININAAIVILTFFTTFKDISVYTIYMLAIAALRGIIASVGNSYQGALGKYIAENNLEILLARFCRFERYFWLISVVSFSSCLLLINPFIQLYTSGIHDAEYYQPMFAAIVTIANMIYVIREPYRLLVLAAGKFKETNAGAIIESIITVCLSIILVMKYGLIGVALGAFIGITYRMLYFVWYLNNDILFRPYKKYSHLVLTSFTVLIINIYIYANVNLSIYNVSSFILYGVGITVFESIIYMILLYLFKYFVLICNFEKRID